MLQMIEVAVKIADQISALPESALDVVVPDAPYEDLQSLFTVIVEPDGLTDDEGNWWEGFINQDNKSWGLWLKAQLRNLDVSDRRWNVVIDRVCDEGY